MPESLRQRASEPVAGVGLRFAGDGEPGFGRRRIRTGFRYVDASGAPIRDRATLARIRALAIPPAWTDVWICRDARGHLQATGRDARGRKQSRYHVEWRRQRDELKFDRMIAFGRAMPRIRRRVAEDLARPGLSKDRVLAAIVRLLESTAMRIGNEEYARDNRSFGLTTMRTRHVAVDGTELRFRFRGKSGKIHLVGIRDRALARIVARCGALPGQELFQYLDADGEPRAIASDDVNAYLREAAGVDVTAKDFRTWIGTLVAFHDLRSVETAAGVPARAASTARASAPAGRAAVKLALQDVADVLGNTPVVSRKSYVAPVVVDSFLDGSLPRARRTDRETGPASPTIAFDRREELELVRFLEQAGTPPKPAKSTKRAAS